MEKYLIRKFRMYEYFDTVPDRHNVSKEYDVSYSMGVLTTVVSKEIGKFIFF